MTARGAEVLDREDARRLALCSAGLLAPGEQGLPARARGGGLRPGEPHFEYWGHEASWLPLRLFPVFEFRRRAFRHHPWWGDVIGKHRKLARDLLERIEAEGPLRSADLEGRGSRGWWDLKVSRKVAAALWSSGELAIRERVGFQRSFDLTERVIPAALRAERVSERAALERLALLALRGHGWASTATLVQTWRLSRHREGLVAALRRLESRGELVACHLETGAGRKAGWILPADLERVDRLRRLRPRRDVGVLLSPFDPLLWDRARVQLLFGFEQILEIFKPAAKRKYGYYCLPVLAGDQLVARLDLKAHRARGRLEVLARHEEDAGRPELHRTSKAEIARATDAALARYAAALGLAVQRP
ncbi:MAG: crosslink repair DNA glycosylase YcaQ family protein [Deltaproteobacteria bacterium]|nr:crosslink repair DNA glycosylase YcaQ family protein [Deltaproteobacteria bacterium]